VLYVYSGCTSFDRETLFPLGIKDRYLDREKGGSVSSCIVSTYSSHEFIYLLDYSVPHILSSNICVGYTVAVRSASLCLFVKVL